MALPSILVFGSQTIWPTSEYLFQLRAALLLEPRLRNVLAAIKDLPKLWEDLITYDPRLGAVPGRRWLTNLVEWLNHGEFISMPTSPPNVMTMPLTIMIHIIQYFRYLNDIDSVHSDILDHTRVGGAQGLCTGILSAIAVACSKSEEDVSNHAVVALRLALCIGAYVDLDGASAQPPMETTSLAVRWRSEAGHDNILKILENYPEAYISVIYDTTDVTITVPKDCVAPLVERLYSQGMTVRSTGLEGRYHTHRHHDATVSLLAFCETRSNMRFPMAEKLLVPLRSNTTAHEIQTGALHEHAVRGIMLELANWHLTVFAAVSQLIQIRKPVAASFGVQEVIPSRLIKESGLKIEKMRFLSLVSNQLPVQSTLMQAEPLAADGAPTLRHQYPEHAVAVIGMACKFPGADSLEEFWDLLTKGTSMVREMPEQRFSTQGLRRSADGKLKFWGNFVRDVDAFDNRFFKKNIARSC
ncbi:MAG: hypothetical protein Q9196_000685 [Gyalolechia fulgens]